MTDVQSRPAVAPRVGPLEPSSLLADDQRVLQNCHPTQVENPRAVAAARRELLRDFVFEAATEAASYLGAVQSFIAADDAPGLKYSATKFVAFAREVARGCKELTASDTGGAP